MKNDKSKRRGRPRKDSSPDFQTKIPWEEEPEKRKRGRPRKDFTSITSEEEHSTVKKNRGRPKEEEQSSRLTDKEIDLEFEQMQKQYEIDYANNTELSRAIHTISVELESKVYKALTQLRSQMAHKNTPLGKFIRICLIFYIEHKTGFTPGTYDEKIARQLYPERFGPVKTDEEIDNDIEQEMKEKGISTKFSKEQERLKQEGKI